MSIAISYTEQKDDNTVYNIVFKEFTQDDIPRAYQGSFNLSESANGATILTGPAYSQKYIWAISSVVPKAEAIELDQLFRDWDTDRASGVAAAVGVTDDTWGATVSTNAIFSTAPTFTYLSPAHTLVSFGLTEV